MEASNPADPPRRSRARVSRLVYLADTDEEAFAALANGALGSPVTSGRLDHFIPEGGSRDDLIMPYLMHQDGIFVGSPETVTQGIKRFYDEVGGFGTLLLAAGRSWGTWEQRQRSWTLFMEEVAPRLRGLDADS